MYLLILSIFFLMSLTEIKEFDFLSIAVINIINEKNYLFNLFLNNLFRTGLF